MKRGWDNRGKRYFGHILVVAPLVLIVYLAAMFVAIRIGSRMDAVDPVPENYGDLSNRFEPSQTMEWEGKTYAHYKSYFTNILVIGMDKNDIGEDAGYRSNGQADFLMYLVIDRHNRIITPIHIDRDTVADVPVYGSFGTPAGSRMLQVCLAHAFGGTQHEASINTRQAVMNLMGGIAIDYYLTMDMEGIAALNDALGGVTVTLDEDFSHLDPAMTQGATITLKGKQAEYFVRGRYGIGDYTNSQRMKHQQAYLDAALPLLREKLTQDEELAIGIFDDLADHLCTNISRTWIMNNTYAFKNYEVKPIVWLEGDHSVGQDGFVEFQPDEEALQQLLIDLFYESMRG